VVVLRSLGSHPQRQRDRIHDRGRHMLCSPPR
jgi:hypothetical protein